MSMYEVEFKIRHECRFGKISSRHPQSRIKKWKTGSRDVIEIIPKNQGDCTSSFEEISQLDGVIESQQGENHGCVIAEAHRCQVENILDSCVEEFGTVLFGPVTFIGGWQYHSIVVLDHDHIAKILAKFESCCIVPWILRKVAFKGFTESQMTVTTETLFSDLTEKQANAILTAFAHGYYKIPRDADVQTIADKISTSRTTFQEHLKKAENKIMGVIVPHIHTWHHFTGQRGTHPTIRESVVIEK